MKPRESFLRRRWTTSASPCICISTPVEWLLPAPSQMHGRGIARFRKPVLNGLLHELKGAVKRKTAPSIEELDFW